MSVELELGAIDITDALSLSADVSDELSIADGKEIFKETGVTSYEMLDDLPRLNGQTIIGDMAEKDPTVPNWAKQETKPTYSFDETGLEELSITAIEALWNGL